MRWTRRSSSRRPIQRTLHIRAAPGIGPEELRAARILIVDDQDANVLLLRRILDAAGYTAVSASTDPAAALELQLANPYDLIILDLEMPGMDGFAVLAALKAADPGHYPPVLVITALPAHKLRALQAGARDFLSKPFARAEVLARVRSLLEVRLLHSATERLYEDLVAERKRALELGALPGAMVGVGKGEQIDSSWELSLRFRHPWLQLNLVTAFAAGAVVLAFQDVIDRTLILAMFLPVLAGQSGNTGCQALAITLRGLFLDELGPGRERAMVRKEAVLGLLNGAMVGAVAAGVMFAIAVAQHLPSPGRLALVVLLAMTGSCLLSGVFGALVPLILKRVGADPAVASSIFLTTASDMASMGLLLGLASVLV